MKKIITTLCTLLLFTITFAPKYGMAANTETNNLSLSDMVVKITSQGNVATFQLYDTVAAKEFYEQLPLTLELSNFRDAQWMFYPPKKLNVKDNESYHNGKKGELSYYAPWGDVFMLYKDFYARDDMHRLGIGLTGVEDIEGMSDTVTIEKLRKMPTDVPIDNKEVTMEKMQITIGEYMFTATLADNSSVEALRDLLAKGSITINMNDYGNFEKVGSLGRKLPTNDERINTKLGDIILYQGHKLVIYYDTNAWSFTRIGKVENTANLREALGKGDVTVTLSLIP